MATAYQFKVSLLGIDPPIWRRFLISGDVTLGDLHDAIQVVMGWEDAHLHRFEARGVAYEPRDLEAEGQDEDGVVIHDVLRKKKDAIRYEYDFGDRWEHEVLVEDVTELTEPPRRPKCIDGERACPPEDCGGPHGYIHLLAVLGDPEDEEHEDMLNWLGEDFDAEHFDVAEVNAIIDSEWR